MRAVRKTGVALLVTLAAVLAMGQGTTGASQLHHAHRSHRGQTQRPLHGSWGSHDRAVYAVSTLNAPLCSKKRQLSSVLWNQYGAREFDVLTSSRVQGLYFIQVKTGAASLLGVYSYQFGDKLPGGVQSSHCVAPAPDSAVTDYKNKDWKFVAHFTSTYPKS